MVKGKTKKAAAKPSIKNATKATGKKARVDVSADGREVVLKMLKDAGLKAEGKAAWTKVEGKEGRRVYVAMKGPQVHLSGFTVKGHHVEQLTEADAKKRRLGRVRGILFIDRNSADALKEAMRSIVGELK